MKNLTSAVLLIFFCLSSNAQNQTQIPHNCPAGTQPATAHITGTITTYNCDTSSREDCQKAPIKRTRQISYNLSYCASNVDLNNLENDYPHTK